MQVKIQAQDHMPEEKTQDHMPDQNQNQNHNHYHQPNNKPLQIK